MRRLWPARPEQQARPARARIVIPEARVADIFAIGDVHGHLDLLKAAEERIHHRMKQLGRRALVICVGDFVDRGPDSRGVIDHILLKMPPPCYRICVCGNHDDAFLKFLRDDEFDPSWFGFGLDTTLMSYGIDVRQLLAIDPSGQRLKQAARQSVPAEHVDFLARLPVAVSIGRYLFVHAGIVPGRPLAEQADHDLMWIREPFLTRGPELDITVVHGHTPVGTVQYGPGRIDIDTGAFATGKLSVVHIGPEGTVEI